MKKFLSIALMLLGPAAINSSFAQGAGSALSFNNNQMQTSAAFNHNIGTGDFTWEAWVKPSVAANGTSGTGKGIMANGNYAPALYVSTGGTAPQAGFGSLGIYWSGIGGNSWKNSGVKLAADKWYHVAIVRNGTTLSFFVNGVQAPNTYAINATASMSNAIFRLGYSGDGSEYMQGNIDEVRIWGVARSAGELRDNMCKKLAGTEAGLKLYYRMDEGSGNTLTSEVSGTPSFTLPAAAPSWTVSGAPVGDTSVSVYATTYSGQSLSLHSPANGNMLLNNISDVSQGMHLYRVDAAPNTVAGIPSAGGNNVYYGVFSADTAMTSPGSTYDAQYDYSNFPAALTYASGISLYNRLSADVAWSVTGAVNNMSTHTLQLTGNSSRKELFIGNFVLAATCNMPTALNAQNVTTTAASLSWTSGGSNAWNLSWGTGSFAPAAGTLVHNLSAASYDLAGLTGNTAYRFYVQDTCGGIGSSAWAGPFSFTTAPDLSMGAGTGLYFNGSESIVTAANVNHSIDTNDFTWEAWINPEKITGSTCIMTNGNFVPALYATTAGSGGNGSVGFYWGGWKNSNTFIEKNKWSHVAMVRSQDTITIYVNGIAAPNRYVMPNAMANSKLRLGWSGDISEYFQGVLDEVRVWKVARTEEELKAFMCQKLQGNEPNLVNYYRLDEGNGQAAGDRAGNATLNGITPARWRVSGAAIGDTSVYVYASDWTGVQLSLGSNGQGVLTADSVAGNVKGMHAYRVNSVPNYTAGVQNIGGTNRYFGVFAAGDYNSADYRVTYDYNSYPAAAANNANVHLYNRKDNSTNQWVQTPATNNTSSNQLRKKQALGTRQYLLADFVPSGCNPPAGVSVFYTDTAHAGVTWSNSTAATHVLQYGEPGFQPGSGTILSVTNDTAQIAGLDPDHDYEFYMQDSCSATSGSAWSGPYAFTTADPCPKPYQVTGDSITSARIILKWEDNGMVTQDYTVSWGLQGFGDPAIGIISNVGEKRFNLDGITANSGYDFYIRANCNSNKPNSGWVGPFTFTTLACDVPYNLSAQNITANTAGISWITGGAAQHNLQYGTAGFSIGNGTLVANVAATTYTLSALQPNTAYDVYVQDSCSVALGSSTWVGPLHFTTQQGTGISGRSSNNNLKVFPNPAQESFRIAVTGEHLATVSLFSSTGQQAMLADGQGKEELSLSVRQLTNGIYFLEIFTDKGTRVTGRIVVQH
ncbi:LamG-like jellyroll fold domain-containing protein [Taibaiella koreensis]|uniref:LamG-like jellyroll fold domain-containing protein n=1 Tax=Taibaiella koreensis TaxID=1268548 RepID=UPI0013C2C9DA|nr:LamG-like jellyroll fold domain-containing protein [Taibaiella koreensis]